MSCHVVNIGYMEQNIVGHMSDTFWKRFLHKTCQTDFVYIVFLSISYGYAVFQNLSLTALKREKRVHPALLKMHFRMHLCPQHI